MNRSHRTLWLFCALSASAFAQQSLSGYSGYIRQEDHYTYEGKADIPLKNGSFLKGNVVQSENRVITVNVSDGEATASIEVDNSENGYSHLYFVGRCINGDVSSVTQIGRTRKQTKGSHSSPATCEANLEEGYADLSCWTDAVYTLRSTNQNIGSSKSGCAEIPNSSTNDTTESSSDYDGYGSGFVMDIPLDGVPAVLSGSETIDLSGGGKRTTTWLIAREGQYELILEPEAEYPNWRPKAGPSETQRGNTLLVKATLKRKDGKPLDIPAREIKFRLGQRSYEPGTMMNFPPAANRANPTLPDLMFEADLNSPLDLQVGGDNGSEAVTVEGSYEEVYVYVSSFDWGAFGALTAEATLRTGERVAGKLKDSSENELLIPKRASVDDPIADGWRKAGANRGGNGLSDEDALPAGDGHNGDGFSLYEEYRGFSVNGTRTEGNPEKKDLFVRNKGGGYTIKGIVLFASRSGLRVLPDISADEINDSRHINFNSSGRFQRVRQHGVVVDIVTEDRGYAIAAGGPGTPAQIQAVEIPLDLYFLNLPAGYADATIAHELGHAVNVWHHGEVDPGNVRFRVVNGEVYESGPGDRSLDAANKTKVTLFKEDGTPVPPSVIAVSQAYYVGVRQGQHSGEETCAMRYDAAEVHVREDPTQRFLNSTNEVVGTTFCSATAGTGVNLQSRMPAPRYGDAAAGRGACAQQICVNDLHVHPEK